MLKVSQVNSHSNLTLCLNILSIIERNGNEDKLKREMEEHIKIFLFSSLKINKRI